jgi:hypothetical protein
MQRRPEAIAGTSEVLLHGGGVEAGIDAAEKNVEMLRDDVGKRRVRGGGEIGF